MCYMYDLGLQLITRSYRAAVVESGLFLLLR